MAALQNVVNALNMAGFSEKECRAFTPPTTTEEPSSSQTKTIDIFDDVKTASSSLDGSGENNLVVDVEYKNDSTITDYGDSASSNENFVRELMQQAIKQNRDYEAQADAAVNADIPSALEDKMNKHKLKDTFREQVLTVKLPQFFTEVEKGGWMDDDKTIQLFKRDYLLEEFKLSQADSTINFEDVESEVYRVDLEEIGDENYKATPFKVNAKSREKFNALILNGNRDSQIMNLIARLAQLIGNMYPIADQEVKKYIGRIVESFSEDQIRDCLERDVSYVRKIKQKITTLANVHAYKTFNDFLDIDKIWLQPSFGFSEIITPSGNAPAIPKSLYTTEAKIGDFEARVINDIANLDNIVWWHRNLSKGKGFWINGFLNHYPDFIVKTKAGKVVIIETKGDDRDNSDSELKLKLGKLWEAKAGAEFKYMMVFDNNPINGAERLADALKKLGEL
jgi:type III restriction enzyme